MTPVLGARTRACRAARGGGRARRSSARGVCPGPERRAGTPSCSRAWLCVSIRTPSAVESTKSTSCEVDHEPLGLLGGDLEQRRSERRRVVEVELADQVHDHCAVAALDLATGGWLSLEESSVIALAEQHSPIVCGLACIVGASPGHAKASRPVRRATSSRRCSASRPRGSRRLRPHEPRSGSGTGGRLGRSGWLNHIA